MSADKIKLESELTTEDDENIVTWESDDEDIAVVDDDGNVTAVGEGYVFINARRGTSEDFILLNVTKNYSAPAAKSPIGKKPASTNKSNEFSDKVLSKIKDSVDDRVTINTTANSQTAVNASVFSQLNSSFAYAESLKINCFSEDDKQHTHSWIFKSNGSSDETKGAKLFVNFNQNKKLPSIYEDIGVMFFEVEDLDEFPNETQLLFRVNDSITDSAIDNVVYLYKYDTDREVYEYNQTLKIYNTNCISIPLTSGGKYFIITKKI